jgi:hypothetical protein
MNSIGDVIRVVKEASAVALSQSCKNIGIGDPYPRLDHISGGAP